MVQKLRLITLCLFCLMPFVALTQVYFLGVKKNNPSKRLRYYQSEQLVFKVKDEKKRTAIITGFSEKDRIIFLNNVPYRLEEFVYISETRFWFSLLQRLSFVSGVSYLSVYAINQGFSSGFSEIDRIYPLSLSLVLFSGILYPMAHKKFRSSKYDFVIHNSNPK